MNRRKSIVRRGLRLLLQAATVGFAAVLVGWFTSVIAGECGIGLVLWPETRDGTMRQAFLALHGSDRWWLILKNRDLGNSNQFGSGGFTWSFSGLFSVEQYVRGGGGDILIQVHPFVLLGILAPAPLLLIAPSLRGRQRFSRCPCGYDLTGNLSGRCPECGRLIRPVRSAPGQYYEPRRSRRRRRLAIVLASRVTVISLLLAGAAVASSSLDYVELELSLKRPNVPPNEVERYQVCAALSRTTLGFTYDGIAQLAYETPEDRERWSVLGLTDVETWNRPDGPHGEIHFDSKVAAGIGAVMLVVLMRRRCSAY